MQKISMQCEWVGGKTGEGVGVEGEKEERERGEGAAFGQLRLPPHVCVCVRVREWVATPPLSSRVHLALP